MQKEKGEEALFYVGVDVGTASVRAALVNQAGTVVDQAEEPLEIWEPQSDHYEQSSADIWKACCAVTKKVAESAGSGQIRGLGFDATCSLVVLDKSFQSLAVNVEGDHNRNVIMWMDHRAGSQVDRINKTKHAVLRYVGGVMSVEMQPPKLLWLKENLRQECWDKTGQFFDLPDFLTWKATGSFTRSLCTLVCKWTYTPDGGWDDSFWMEIGLEDLLEQNYAKIGNQVVSPGVCVGNELTPEAARELGLPQGIAVAAALIDAHAGGLGVIGADVTGHHLPCEKEPITSRLALICGTSSCHMAVSENPIFVPGVWGPYYSAMVPGYWLNEGGQSATGRLIDHVVRGHNGYEELQRRAEESGQHVYAYLNRHLDQMRASRPERILGADLHVWPDFHGNRSPLADVTLKGMIVGLTLSKGLDDLALLYLATLRGIALGTRHIIEAMKTSGHAVSSLFMCGGLSKNPLFVQVHADVTGLPVILSKEVESVLVGAAILGACASSDFSSIQDHFFLIRRKKNFTKEVLDIIEYLLGNAENTDVGLYRRRGMWRLVGGKELSQDDIIPPLLEQEMLRMFPRCEATWDPEYTPPLAEAMQKMGRVGNVILPDPELRRFYEKKFGVHLKLYQHQREYQRMMEDDQ